MKKQIPNSITLVNLFCGCCAALCIFNEMYLVGFWFIFVGGWADYADGFIARWLGVDSPLGKELDSLADMVTFGVVPGAIVYMLLSNHSILASFSYEKINILALPAFIISVFSGLRLAKFNLDTRQSEDFLGLPTPASTMLIVGLMLIYHFDSFGLKVFVSHPYFLYPVVLGLSYLLISEIPMFSMKFKGMQWKGNEQRIIFITLLILMFIFLKEVTFSIIIFLYIFYCLTERIFSKKTQNQA